jgi:hypothetical protein
MKISEKWSSFTSNGKYIQTQCNTHLMLTKFSAKKFRFMQHFELLTLGVKRKKQSHCRSGQAPKGSRRLRLPEFETIST